jgi:hypothetical protein
MMMKGVPSVLEREVRTFECPDFFWSHHMIVGHTLLVQRDFSIRNAQLPTVSSQIDLDNRYRSAYFFHEVKQLS